MSDNCGHVHCDRADEPRHVHDVPAEECSLCHAIADPLVAAIEDECPKCGAYVLNQALHADWHVHLRKAIENAGEYKPSSLYR